MSASNTDLPDRSRVPSGVPTGGQFVEELRDEPGSQLMRESQLRSQDGSFDFPEPILDPDEHMKFWDHVQVPDRALSDVSEAYKVGWDRWAGEQMMAFDDIYDQAHGQNVPPDQVEVDRQAEWDRLQAAYPAELNPSAVRAVARAFSMAVFARINLDELGVRRVRAHTMPWPDRDRPERTVEEIVEAVGPAWDEISVVLDPQHPAYDQRRSDANDGGRAELLETTSRAAAELRELRADNQVLLEELGNINNTTHDGAAAVQDSVDRLTKKFVATEIFRKRS